jgi:tetratricopeptide (TPR) repeat protein
MEFKSGPIRLSVGAKPRDPAADRAQVQAIEAKLDEDDIEAAVALAQAALAQGLEHPLIFGLAAEQLVSEDRYAEALALLERGHRQAPDDLELRQALGLCLFRLQKFEAALPHFDVLAAAQPDFAQGHAALGATLEALGRIQAAEAAFRRAHDLDPGNILAVAGLASTASQAGRHGEARGFAERVLAAQPGYPDAILALARADLAQGEYAAGEARLHALIADARSTEPQRKAAHGLIGELQAARDRKFDA